MATLGLLHLYDWATEWQLLGFFSFMIGQLNGNSWASSPLWLGNLMATLGLHLLYDWATKWQLLGFFSSMSRQINGNSWASSPYDLAIKWQLFGFFSSIIGNLATLGLLTLYVRNINNSDFSITFGPLIFSKKVHTFKREHNSSSITTFMSLCLWLMRLGLEQDP